MSTKSPSRVDEYVGQQIKSFREISKMSQTKLAENVDVTFQQIQKYENGVNRVSAGKLYKIAAVLQKPIASFYPPTPLGNNAPSLTTTYCASCAQVFLWYKNQYGYGWCCSASCAREFYD